MKDINEVFRTKFWNNLNSQIEQDDLLTNRGSLTPQPKHISKSDIRSIFTSTLNDFLLNTTEEKLLLCEEVISNASSEQELLHVFNKTYPSIELYLTQEKQVAIMNPDNI